MKKKILSVLLVVSMVLVLCSCSKKEAVTANDFKSSMEELEYTVTDQTSQFKEGVVDSVQLAEKDKYQIEFYVVPSIEQAKNAYEQNKSTIEKAEKASSPSSHKSVAVKNYSYYKVTTGDSYYVTSRVDNTFIYAVIPIKYKNHVIEIISKLGY
ncbi:hypothetical protein [Clostridium sp.]